MNRIISAALLAATAGGAAFITGCATEAEPMPPGVFIQPSEKDPENVVAPKAGGEIKGGELTGESFDVPGSMAPASSVTPSSPAAGLSARKEEVKYVVQKNDNLSKIAYRHGVSVKAIMERNGLKKTVIHPKQTLIIPVPTAKSAVKSSKNTAKSAKTAKSSKTAKTAKAAASAAVAVDGVYIVKAGDNFSTIAKRCHVKVSALAEANPGVNSNRLQIGQKLNLPQGGAAPAAKASASAAPAAKAAAPAKASAAPAPAAPAEKSGNKSASIDDLLSEIENQDAPAKTEVKTDAPAAPTAPAADSKKDSAADLLSNDVPEAAPAEKAD